MTGIARCVLLFLGAAIGDASTAKEQGPYCKALDQTGNRLLYTAQRQTTTPSDSAERRNVWTVPLLAPSDVAFVTDENVCQQAATAYDREVSPETSTLTRGVYVIRLGTSYLVVDSEYPAGEWMRGIVLDSSFAKQSGIVGL